jgi:hypothetical protein
MTAHDPSLPDTPASRTDATPDAPATRASRDTATVIVWRITADTVGDADAAGNSDAGGSSLTPRLAHHLVAIYSDVHGTVIDFDADINLRHAAERTGRTYLAVTDTGSPTASADQPGPASMIMLRWPRPATTAPRQRL